MNVFVTDTGANSYRGSTSAKVLEKAVHEKKAKYEKACFEQRCGRAKAWMALVAMHSNTMLLRVSKRHYSWKPEAMNGFMDGAEGILHED